MMRRREEAGRRRRIRAGAALDWSRGGASVREQGRCGEKKRRGEREEREEVG